MNNLYTFKKFNESKTPYYDYPTIIDREEGLIVPKNNKNVFKLVIKNIGEIKHTLKTLFLKDKEEVIKIIDFCKWVGTHYDYEQIEKVGKELFGNKLKDFLDMDKTGYTYHMCIPQIESIIYFDENGDEHKVKIK